MAKIAKALKSGIAMATSRFQFGDDYTIEDFRHTEKYHPEKEGAAFSKEINGLLGEGYTAFQAWKQKWKRQLPLALEILLWVVFLPALLS